MTRLVIMVKSKIFKGYSIILNRQCYRSLCVDVMMLVSLFCYLFIYVGALVLRTRHCNTLYTRYPIVARAWPSARASKGILHTMQHIAVS